MAGTVIFAEKQGKFDSQLMRQIRPDLIEGNFGIPKYNERNLKSDIDELLLPNQGEYLFEQVCALPPILLTDALNVISSIPIDERKELLLCLANRVFPMSTYKLLFDGTESGTSASKLPEMSDLPVSRRIINLSLKIPTFIGYFEDLPLEYELFKDELELVSRLSESQLFILENLAIEIFQKTGETDENKWLLIFHKLATVDRLPEIFDNEYFPLYAQLYRRWWRNNSNAALLKECSTNPSNIRFALLDKIRAGSRKLESENENPDLLMLMGTFGSISQAFALKNVQLYTLLKTYPEPLNLENEISIEELQLFFEKYYVESRRIASIYGDRNITPKHIQDLFKETSFEGLMETTADLLAQCYCYFSYAEHRSNYPMISLISQYRLDAIELLVGLTSMKFEKDSLRKDYPNSEERYQHIKEIFMSREKLLTANMTLWLMVLSDSLFDDYFKKEDKLLFYQVRLDSSNYIDAVGTENYPLVGEIEDGPLFYSGSVVIYELKAIFSTNRRMGKRTRPKLNDVEQLLRYVDRYKKQYPGQHIEKAVLHYVSLGGVAVIEYTEDSLRDYVDQERKKNSSRQANVNVNKQRKEPFSFL